MTEDFHHFAVEDATMRFLAAPLEHREACAGRLVDAQFAAGRYPEVQALDEETRSALVKLLLEQFWAERGEKG